MKKTFIVFIYPKEEFNKDLFEEHMRTYSNWARLSERLWMVTYLGNASQLRDAISHSSDSTCNILVINITNDGWASVNIDRRLTDWMQENI